MESDYESRMNPSRCFHPELVAKRPIASTPDEHLVNVVPFHALANGKKLVLEHLRSITCQDPEFARQPKNLDFSMSSTGASTVSAIGEKLVLRDILFNDSWPKIGSAWTCMPCWFDLKGGLMCVLDEWTMIIGLLCTSNRLDIARTYLNAS